MVSLLVSALTVGMFGGKLDVDLRCKALTAIHDIMKIENLLPTARAPAPSRRLRAACSKGV